MMYKALEDIKSAHTTTSKVKYKRECWKVCFADVAQESSCEHHAPLSPKHVGRLSRPNMWEDSLAQTYAPLSPKHMHLSHMWEDFPHVGRLSRPNMCPLRHILLIAQTLPTCLGERGAHVWAREGRVCAIKSMCRKGPERLRPFVEYVPQRVCAAKSMCRKEYVPQRVCAAKSMCRKGPVSVPDTH